MQTELFSPSTNARAADLLDQVLHKPAHQINSQEIGETLDHMFPEQQHENKDLKATKQILKETAQELSTHELTDITTEIKYLTDNWLDDFERSIFQGLTLKELLHENAGR